ncbi:MAG: hypothetical protein R2838_18095 [Caldilineaceae bacterium]
MTRTVMVAVVVGASVSFKLIGAACQPAARAGEGRLDRALVEGDAHGRGQRQPHRRAVMAPELLMACTV